MPMYEFACECGQRIERLTVYETVSVQCACGGDATRVLSAPAFKLEGWSGDFPTAHGRFAQIHAEKLSAERRTNS